MIANAENDDVSLLERRYDPFLKQLPDADYSASGPHLASRVERGQQSDHIKHWNQGSSDL
jgi:hypothetical protein